MNACLRSSPSESTLPTNAVDCDQDQIKVFAEQCLHKALDDLLRKAKSAFRRIYANTSDSRVINEERTNYCRMQRDALDCYNPHVKQSPSTGTKMDCLSHANDMLDLMRWKQRLIYLLWDELFTPHAPDYEHDC